ncbi:hypothetical protein DL93DRAFT_1187039 [Clavulina sp. PMI_390]|nr:hypothetical protein DL93DRAFT_1187039 [Clavulina sp. PMI_390]
MCPPFFWHKVNALRFFHCSREIIHHEWQIALVVEVIHSLEAEGPVEILASKAGKRTQRLTPDEDLIKQVAIGGKFAQRLSTFAGFDLDDDINYAKFSRFINFLSVEYLQILQEGGTYIYRYDSRTNRPIGGFMEGTPSQPGDIAAHLNMHGFQKIIMLSQDSLDQVYSGYYAQYSWMREFSVAEEFSMKYKALTIRLLSNNRALVCIPIKSGKLRTIGGGQTNKWSNEHQISNWELVFDVGIQMVDGAGFAQGDPYFDTEAWAHFKSAREVKLQQLVLDFETAKFEFGLSHFNNPQFGCSRLSLEMAVAAHHYLRQHYFRNMTTTSARVIHTVFLSKEVTGTRSRCDFANTVCHIYSRTPITRENYMIIPPGEEPVVAILGMTDPQRQLPSADLCWSANWLYGSGATLGTLALSKDVFLEGRLLPLLEGVNRATTLVPAKLDMDAGEWLIELTTWKKKYSDKPDRAAS